MFSSGRRTSAVQAVVFPGIRSNLARKIAVKRMLIRTTIGTTTSPAAFTNSMPYHDEAIHMVKHEAMPTITNPPIACSALTVHLLEPAAAAFWLARNKPHHFCVNIFMILFPLSCGQIREAKDIAKLNSAMSFLRFSYTNFKIYCSYFFVFLPAEWPQLRPNAQRSFHPVHGTDRRKQYVGHQIDLHSR